MSDFLPKDYQVPEPPSNYLKFAKGETHFRFISSPIVGYIYWTEQDGKKIPNRVRTPDEVPTGVPAKYFWSAIVFDYATSTYKILEITQKSIMATITSLNASKSWGSPKDYDLYVTREGDGMETTYTTMPSPKTDLPMGADEALMKINLEALYEGKDPFTNS